MVQGTVLNAGSTTGTTLVLTEPVSFWGAFDPRSGKIIDAHHPQCGAAMGGRILLLPETRGSGGTPGGIAEAIRLRTGPLGIILMVPDINLAIGASVAQTLYGIACPVVAVAAKDYAVLCQIPVLTIFADGLIEPA